MRINIVDNYYVIDDGVNFTLYEKTDRTDKNGKPVSTTIGFYNLLSSALEKIARALVSKGADCELEEYVKRYEQTRIELKGLINV